AEARRSLSIEVPRSVWAEMEADGVWWSEVCSIPRELNGKVPQGDRISAGAVSALGPCLVPVDKFGWPLRPAILYGVDTRSGPQSEASDRRYDRDPIRELCGNRLSSQSPGPKILWL